MKRFIEDAGRTHGGLLASVDDYVAEDNPVSLHAT